ncbi:beta-ketoacyl-ACP synthase III [Paenibacillus senegalensis]|uniref:beta-ketoacyl-ACP synthase III n=1 Tax=Paenibacillus senegalensis TaxID=1465766 RepID=UPI000288AD68|nr:beta-ketoacyl-ACP synthase III [Paenibacillus senegalensis]
MQQTRQVKILGTGKYMPKAVVTAAEMDKKLGQPPGWSEKISDVRLRHFVDGETASYMGAQAAKAALLQAGLEWKDIDCIVCASGTMEQPIPCNAALMQRELGTAAAGIPAFDINTTCLSFLTGLDVLSYMIAAGRYRHVMLVSSEIASLGLNWSNKESAVLFGDGAAAAVIAPSEEGEGSRILCSRMETYAEGAAWSEIRGGGTKLPATRYNLSNEADYLFHMDGRAIFKLASRLLPDFVQALLQPSGFRLADIRLVIPHQGSAAAMRLILRKLRIAEEQLMYITPNHGNTIAASIPMGLHEAISTRRIERGDLVLLLGTSAGLSLGGLLLEY